MKYDYGLKPLKFWCQKVLPLVYDESLSYEELLCKVVAYLNEVIEGFNGIPEYIQSLVSDEKLKEILSDLLNELEEQVAAWNEQENENATKDMSDGELVWLNNKLYQMTRDILAGDKYVIEGGTGVTPNVTKVTIEGLIGNLKNLTTDEKANLVGSINELLSKLNTEKGRIDSILDTIGDIFDTIGDTDDLTTEDKSSLVNSINEVNGKVDTNTGNIGDLDNLETTDKDNLVDAINEVISNCGDLDNLSTTEKASLVSAINEVVERLPIIDYVTPDDYGAVGDGVTDDTDAVQSALDSGKPVKLLHNHAVTSVVFKWGLDKCRYFDGNGFSFIGLDATKHIVEFMQGTSIIKRLKMVGLAQIGQASALYWHNPQSQASGFNHFYDIYFDMCYHCLEYGDGNVGALSENYINGWFDYSCNVLVTSSGKGNQLFFNNCNLNATRYSQYQSGDPVQMFTNGSGSILTFNQCTIENTTDDTQNGFVNSGEIYCTNCVFEIAGINFATYRNANGVDNDGFISLNGIRAFQGGTGKHFLEIGDNAHVLINDLYLLKSATYEFMGDNASAKVELDNINAPNTLFGTIFNADVIFGNCVFNGFSTRNAGYEQLTKDTALQDIHSVHGEIEVTITDASSSVFIYDGTNYIMVTQDVGTTKKHFAIGITQFSLFINYPQNVTIKGGVHYV